MVTLTLTPEGPARPYWTLTSRGVAWLAQRPPLKRSAPCPRSAFCFYPRERLTVEPTKTYWIGKVQVSYPSILGHREKTEKEKGKTRSHTRLTTAVETAWLAAG